MFIDFNGVEHLHFGDCLGMQDKRRNFSFWFDGPPLCGKCFYLFLLLACGVGMSTYLMEAPFLIGDMSPSSFPSYMPLVKAFHLIALLKGLHFIILALLFLVSYQLLSCLIWWKYLESMSWLYFATCWRYKLSPLLAWYPMFQLWCSIYMYWFNTP